MRELALKTGHLTPELLREEIGNFVQAPERIYITHPKPQYFMTIKKQIAALRMKNVTILKDGDIIRV
jgi:hypothetical protein